MNSGTKWSPRNGSQYQRLCARAGCGAPAAVTLRFESTQRQAWFVELDEHAVRTQGDLCNRHAAALLLPRGWELHDERTTTAATTLEAAPEALARKNGNGHGNDVRRVRVRRRVAGLQVVAEPARLPGLEPEPGASGSVETGDPPEAEAIEAEAIETESARVGSINVGPIGVVESMEPEALGEILDARTPLLQRAFRNTKPA